MFLDSLNDPQGFQAGADYGLAYGSNPSDPFGGQTADVSWSGYGDKPSIDWGKALGDIGYGAGQIASALGRKISPIDIKGHSGIRLNFDEQRKIQISALPNTQDASSNMRSIEARLRQQFSYTPQHVYRDINQQPQGKPFKSQSKVPTSSELAAFKSGYKYGG